MIVRKGDNVSELVDDVKYDRRRDCDNTILKAESQDETQDFGLLGEVAPVVVRTGVRLALFKLFGVT